MSDELDIFADYYVDSIVISEKRLMDILVLQKSLGIVFMAL